MDLGAYVQIKDLEHIAEQNGITVSRLRGYRLMRNEKAFSKSELLKGEQDARLYAYEQILASDPPFMMNPQCYSWDNETSRRREKYLILDGDGHTVGFRMDRLHGKKRKAAKYEIRRFVKAQQTQTSLWNKYAGREDVLYIHARLGSWNWSDINWTFYEKDDWFLGGCDDCFDSSYCDLYARIDPKTAQVKKAECE